MRIMKAALDWEKLDPSGKVASNLLRCFVKEVSTAPSLNVKVPEN